MSKTFEISVRDALARGASLDELILILKEWRDLGLTAESVTEILEQMRKNSDQEAEHRILEMMDIATGFCRPELRVWEMR